MELSWINITAISFGVYVITAAHSYKLMYNLVHKYIRALGTFKSVNSDDKKYADLISVFNKYERMIFIQSMIPVFNYVFYFMYASQESKVFGNINKKKSEL